LERLEVEYPNLRSAVVEGAGPDHALLVARLCIALRQFWIVRRTHIREGLQWLEDVLSDRDALPAAQRAWVLGTAGELYSRIDAHERAKPLVAQSLTLFSQLKDTRGIADALIRIGSYERDHARALAHYEESLALARAQGDRHAMAWALLWLGTTKRIPSDPAQQHRLLAECLALYRATGHLHGIANALLVIGGFAFGQGDYAAACAYNEERLAIETALHNASGIANCLSSLGMIALAQDKLAAAGVYFSESLARTREVGIEQYVTAEQILLAYVAAEQHDTARARTLLRESLARLPLQEKPFVGTIALYAGALLAAAEGSAALAAHLYGAAEALIAAGGNNPQFFDEIEGQFFHERTGTLLRTWLADPALADAVSAGRGLRWEQALEQALACTDG